ncbi:MAG: DNRLRE domain-containing protein [Paludibacter sp.]|jgi:hypothetical protein|nr:DNRLRE domain-containing protein [Paludibacter sp.]
MKKLLLSLIALCSFTGILWSQTTEIQPTNNGYVNEGAPTVTLGTYAGWDFQVKRATGFSRWGYLEFPLADINNLATSINLKIYLAGNPPITDFYTSDDLNSTPAVVLGVNKINYSFDNTLTWNNKTAPDANNEESVGTVTLTNDSKSTWISLDVTSLAKSMKTAGQTYIRFRFFVDNGAGIGQLLHFRQMQMNGSTVIGTGAYYPRLVQVLATGLHEISAQNSILYPSIAFNRITVRGENAQIYDVNGKLVLNEIIKNNSLDISTLKNGIYIVKTEVGSGRFIKQ